MFNQAVGITIDLFNKSYAKLPTFVPITQKQIDYYKEKLEQGEDIEIKELASKLPADSDEGFYSFNQASEAPLEDSFQADRGMLKTLAKFSGQGGGMTISFDRKHYGDRITYNAETDTLVIKGIPPNLKDQLLKSNG